ncbi:MAG TPA: nucleoside-diphosphate kinase, partial [Erysipelothrix sp.]|nr:nucleoside-diphosphate kinase [Erysipelothrix sp.]
KADRGTLRNMFSHDNYEIADREERLVENVIHASDSHESAKRELHLWSEYLNA